MANSIRKPLSFSTTTRNPVRIADFLTCVLPFENHILTNEIMYSIMGNAIKHKLYKPLYISHVKRLKEIYESEDLFSNEDVDLIMEHSPQHHKESGFEYGWSSRFDTFFKLAKEFGFIYYWVGEKIIISETGHMLIDAIREEQPNLIKIQKVFLNALMKYQTNNPFRKNLNSNAPLPLLLQVIKLLNEDVETKSAGIHRKELPLLICAPSANPNIIYQQIKSLRKQFGFSYGDEIIYDICFDYLEATPIQRRRFKMSQITSEAVDEYIRKMRITGIISLRGNGRFIDFNSFEQSTINYIIDNYVKYPTFDTEKDYYNYMSKIDTHILEIEENCINSDADNVKQKTLQKWANEYSFEDLSTEMKITSNKNSHSQNEVLKILDEPTRFEFLTSIILKKRYPNLIVKPNYSVDDEGLPKFTAAGGMADIECFDKENNPLVEVTLMQSRTQSTNEIPAITRHLQDAQKLYPEKFIFTLFIAPSIHRDTIYMTEFSKERYKVDIIPLTTNEFLEEIPNMDNLVDFVTCANGENQFQVAELNSDS